MNKSPQKEKVCFKLELACFGWTEEGDREMSYLLGYDAV